MPLTCGETGGRGGLAGRGRRSRGAAGAAAVVARGQALLQAPSLPRRGPAHGRGNRGTEMKNVPRVARGPDVAQHEPGVRRAPGAGSSAAPCLGLSWPVQPRSETPTAPRRRGTPLPTGPARLFMPPLRLLRSRPVSCFSRRRADRGSGWAGPLRSPVPTQAPAPGGLFTGGSEGACLPGPTGCSSRGPLRPRTAIPLGVGDSEPPSHPAPWAPKVAPGQRCQA